MILGIWMFQGSPASTIYKHLVLHQPPNQLSLVIGQPRWSGWGNCGARVMELELAGTIILTPPARLNFRVGHDAGRFWRIGGKDAGQSCAGRFPSLHPPAKVNKLKLNEETHGARLMYCVSQGKQTRESNSAGVLPMSRACTN